MFIPMEGEKLVCLENVAMIYRGERGSVILKRDGSTVISSLTPVTLKRRYLAFCRELETNGRSFL
ncbi:MAG: hypothetical protein Q4F74_02140 [Synergistaceae bacterium]|nr:hypothetical protein [Synergistaceae bacterium]